MRRLLGAVLLSFALLAPATMAMAESPSLPAPKPAQPVVAAQHPDWKPLAIGIGAIAGVVIFNVAAIGFEALPGGLAYEAGATVPAEASVAISRIYATSAAVVGGLVAYYILAE